MNEDHTPGRCYACRKNAPVRWKNLYTIGSEGTDLCLPCELKVVKMLRDSASEAMLAEKDAWVAKRRLRNQAKLTTQRSSDDNTYNLET